MMSDSYLTLVNEKLESRGEILRYLAISGSHAWGLQREDSDIDLRGVYQKPTDKILSLHEGKDTIEFTEGKLDVQLYEVKKFFNMLYRGNGNMVTLLNLPVRLFEADCVPWCMLGKLFLTKKLCHYYRGYADSQRKRALSQRGDKALIYTYREMFSGLYLMRYGVMIFDFHILWREAEHNKWYTKGLLYKYHENPKLTISDSGWDQFYQEWEELANKLKIEADNSKLPDDYDGYEVCNSLLLALRGSSYETWKLSVSARR